MTLEELRQALAEVDRDIVVQLGRRLALASEIGQEKRRRGLPARDYQQEREVLERALVLAKRFDVPAALAEELLLALIRSSLTVQEREGVVATGGGSGQRALVIGGGGKMGRWFVRFLASQGFSIDDADPAGPVTGCGYVPDPDAATIDHDLVVVAAQLRASAEVLKGLSQRPPTGVVFDIGSLKSPLREGLEALRQAGARVTSVHPMFGPATELLSGRHVLFVDVGVPEATARARALFDPTMAIQTELDLESHDRLIAYVLGLSHALNIAFFTALANSGAAAPLLARLSSTTFEAQLAIAAQVAAENPHLYFEIQSLNDFGSESLVALHSAVERLRAVVGGGDEAGFVALMEQGRAYLAQRERGDR
jgi:chorismate mutase/prephenate dehydrogenase